MALEKIKNTVTNDGGGKTTKQTTVKETSNKKVNVNDARKMREAKNNYKPKTQTQKSVSKQNITPKKTNNRINATTEQKKEITNNLSAKKANTKKENKLVNKVDNFLNTYFTDEGINNLPDDNKYKQFAQKLDSNFSNDGTVGSSFLTSETELKQKAKEARNKLSTETLLSGQESKGGSISSNIESALFGGYKMSDEEINQLGGVSIDKRTGQKADDDYVNALYESFNNENEAINNDYDDLTTQYKNGLVSADDYVNQYEELNKRNEELKKKYDELSNYEYKTGKEYYDWLKQNGTEQEIKDFEAYVSSYDDSYLESLSNSYKASLLDLVNTPFEAKALNDVRRSLLLGGDKGEILENYQDSTAVKLNELSSELKSYTLNGKNSEGVRSYSLQTISSLMPMINDALVATIAGTAMGVPDVSKFASRFTNFQMGTTTAGEVFRQRLAEGNDIENALYNAIPHGVLAGLVEGLEVGNVVNIVDLFSGNVGSSLLGVGLFSLPNFVNMLISTSKKGFGESIEELAETGVGHYIDRFQNYLLGKSGSEDRIAVGPSVFDKDTYGAIGEGGLRDQMIMAFAGAVLMDVPTNVGITIDSVKKYNASGEAIKFWNSVSEYSIQNGDMESAQKAKAIADFIQSERVTYEDKTSIPPDAVQFASDMAEEAPSLDSVLNITANGFRLDVCDEIDYVEGVEQQTEQLRNEIADSLAKRGITFKGGVDQYTELDENTRRNVKQLAKYANELGLGIEFDSDENIKNIVRQDLLLSGMSPKEIENKLNKSFVDGYFDNSTGNIVINTKTELGHLSTMIHEITHGTESSKYYGQLENFLRENYNKQLQDTLKENKKVYEALSADAMKESVARTIQNELGNEEFVSKLIKYNNSLAYRIYDNIRAMASSDIKTQLENTFERAFRDAQNMLAYQEMAIQNSMGDINKTAEINDKYNDSYYTLDNLRTYGPIEVKTYDKSISKNQTELRKAVWEKLNEEKIIRNKHTNDVAKINSKTITNSKSGPKSVYTLLENIEDIFNDAILLNRTEYIGDKQPSRKGDKYSIYYAEFSDGNKDYLAKIVVEDSKTKSDPFYEPNIHKVRSFDVTELPDRKKEVFKLRDGETIKQRTLSTISIDQLLNDVNNYIDTKTDLPEPIYKQLNDGKERIQVGKDAEYRKMYSLGQTNDAQLHKERAIEEFDTTYDYRKAGYILDDGEYLDLSEGQNRRTQDHRSVGIVFDDLDYGRDGMSIGMISFMNEGNIRILPESGGVDISNVVEPTSKQYQKLGDFLEHYWQDGYTIDISDEQGRPIESIEYPPRTSTRKVINDIKQYFEDGTIPEANNTSNYFRYSFGEKGDSSTKDSDGEKVSEKDRQYFKGSRLTDGQGNLLRIYHTSPRLFTEFNPVGSNYYRFGDKVVNYYSTDSKVSGSYTDDRYGQIKTAKDINTVQNNADKWTDLQKQINELGKEFDNYENAKGEEISEIIMSDSFRGILKEVQKKLSDFVVPTDRPLVLNAYGTNSNEAVKYNIDSRIVRALDQAMVDPPGFARNILEIYGDLSNGVWGSWQLSPELIDLFEPLFNLTNDINKISGIYSEITNKYQEIKAQRDALRNEQNRYRSSGGKQYVGYGKSINPYILNSTNESRTNWDSINDSDYSIDRETFNNITNEIVRVLSETDYKNIDELKTQNRINRFILSNVNDNIRKYLINNPVVLANVTKIIAESKSATRNYYPDSKTVADDVGRSLAMQGKFNLWQDNTKFNKRLETNDVVNAVLAINDYVDTPYDGVIFRNITDSGSESAIGIRSDIIALFDSNQFKLIGNENPTASPDMRYSLGETNKSDTQNSVSPEIQAGLDANQEAIDKYGAYGLGNKPVRDLQIAKRTDDGPVSRFINNIVNSNYVSDEEAVKIQSRFKELGKYEETSNKKQIKVVRKMIQQMGLEDSYKYIMNADSLTTVDVDNVFLQQLVNEFKLKGLEGTPAYYELIARGTWRSSMSGKALQAFNEWRTQSPEGQIITIRSEIERIQQGLSERYGEGTYDIQINEGLIEEYLRARTQEERDEIRLQIAMDVAKQIPPTIVEQLNSFRHLSMLFNPRTWVKNRLANELFGYINETTRAVRTIGEAVAQNMGVEIEREAGIYNPLSKQERALYKEFVKDFDANFKNRDMKYTTYDVGNILLDSEFGKEVSENRDQFTSAFLNKLTDIQGKMLSDRPGLSKAYAKTMVGYFKVNNLSLDTVTEEQMQKAREFAYKEARHATFNADNKLATWLVNANRELAKRHDALGYGGRALIESFIPFKRTPLNLMATGARYTPAGLAYTLTNDLAQLKKGKITANQFIDNLSQGLVGSGIMALGALLFNLGIFRTKDDDKDRKKYFDQDNGEQDYSINWDGGSYTIDWADPMIIPLAMGAEVMKMVNDGTFTLDDAYRLMSAMAEPLFETSMLSGITNNLQSYANDSTGYITDIIANAGKNYLSQYIPSVLGALARTIDDTRRTTYTSKDEKSLLNNKFTKQVKNKIPGLSQTNQPYINRKGEAEKNEDLGMGIAGRAVLQFLSPGYYSEKDIDKYDEEMYRLYDETGDLNALPSSTNKSLTYEGETYNFSSEQYTQWQKTRWQTEAEYVNQFIDSNAYQNLTDEERVETIKDIRTYAQKVAKKQFLESQGIEYEDKQLTGVQGALDNDIDLYAYYDYLNNSGSKQAEKVAYLEESDLSQKQKEYLWSLNDYKKSYEDVYKKVFDGSDTNKSTKKKSSSKSKNKSTGKTSSTSSKKRTSGHDHHKKSTNLKKVGSVSKGTVSKASSNRIVGNPDTGTNVRNSYLKAYSNNMRSNSEVSTGNGQVVCWKCKHTVTPVNGKCPICGAQL